MLKFKNYLLLYFIIFSFFNSVEAVEKVAFLDLDHVFNNSEPGKKIVISLKDLNKKNINKLKEKENLIKKKENEIKQKQNVIAESELLKEIDVLKNNISEFRKFKDNLAKDFNKKKSDELINFMKIITPIIEKYMEENSIDVLFDKKNIFIGRSNHDITNDIVKLVNNEIK